MTSDPSDVLIPLSGDLHIHSSLSPCAEDRMTPRGMMANLIRFGIDVFSITDHNSGANCPAFAEVAEEHGIMFIPGIELQTSEEIHLLGYFPSVDALQGFCSGTVEPLLRAGMVNEPERFGNQTIVDGDDEVVGQEEYMLSMPLDLSFDDLVARIHDHSGIAVAAHLERGFSLVSQLGFIPSDTRIDAVEVRDLSKLDEIRTSYMEDIDMNVLSSSDSHYLDMMQPPKMKLWVEERDVHSCLRCIRGEGPGRITISEKRVSTRRKGGTHRGTAGAGRKDWRSLYGR